MTNVDLSVIKRRTESIDRMERRLRAQGFSQTESILNGKVRYYENQEGIGLTLIDGPLGTVLTPSGPVRGTLFGERSVGIGIEREVDTPSNSGTTMERGSESSTQFNV
jgi:hypothetical protein